jgi:isoleucyl-tRNA synthetase
MQEEVAADYERFQFHLVAQKLQTFCSEDLGAFYLDVLKDRLYTCPADSHARRSAQTALWHITQSLLRLMAPVLSFTAEEAWQVFARKDDDSVFFHTWHKLPEAKLAPSELKSWEEVRQFRDMVSKAIEEKRAAKELGSSLEAEVDIHAPGPLYHSLERLGNDLRFVLLTSRATLHRKEEAPASVKVAPSAHPKCERCWHYRDDVGSDPAHPTICGRCVSNLFGAGEARSIA